MTAVSTPLGGRAVSSEINTTRSKTSWDYVGPQSQEVQIGLFFLLVLGSDAGYSDGFALSPLQNYSAMC